MRHPLRGTLGLPILARLRSDAALFDLPPLYGKNVVSLAKRAGQG